MFLHMVAASCLSFYCESFGFLAYDVLLPKWAIPFSQKIQLVFLLFRYLQIGVVFNLYIRYLQLISNNLLKSLNMTSAVRHVVITSPSSVNLSVCHVFTHWHNGRKRMSSHEHLFSTRSLPIKGFCKQAVSPEICIVCHQDIKFNQMTCWMKNGVVLFSTCKSGLCEIRYWNGYREAIFLV